MGYGFDLLMRTKESQNLESDTGFDVLRTSAPHAGGKHRIPDDFPSAQEKARRN